eukprot:TRINITY_DN69574_c0_g1_i1.p1 TRINITY_DN69574_c0_g1~~TRINITY_DN69574_c0_g1_i1.p1  ORF type:complete len:564 (+),score=98.73 TRINITY_DN69574_c0_g1_i1:78-1769(+)
MRPTDTRMQMRRTVLVCHVLALHLVAAAASTEGRPQVHTPLGTAVGSHVAAGVERYGNVPYALPPLGPRRFSRAVVNDVAWPGGELDATLLTPPCIQNPLGDPRSVPAEAGPPTEDCLRLNIWTPAANRSRDRAVSSFRAGLLPVMVYLFGGGLCGGFAGNDWHNGSNLVASQNVVVVTVSYRLGALGFMVGSDPSRPGSGGMNGIYDNIVALEWLHRYIAAFGGNAEDITLFGQSSGGYSVCTLCVAPAAKGLFRRASLLSGPCLGGPTGRGWGPMWLRQGRNVSDEILKAHKAQSLDELRELPAEKIQWPDEWMNDLDKAPYFSGYFEDPSVVPLPTVEMWQRGLINPEELMVSFTSKDGTSAYYGTSPTLGRRDDYNDTNTPEGYVSKLRAAWGRDADRVLALYPLEDYPSAPSAFVQADADAYVICPSRQIAHFAATAQKRVWVSEYAHFQPSPSKPKGCEGFGPKGCKGWGCDNGVELDVVPGYHSEDSKLWATHGASFRYIFGTTEGPDGVETSNVSYCERTQPERSLSEQMMVQPEALCTGRRYQLADMTEVRALL